MRAGECSFPTEVLRDVQIMKCLIGARSVSSFTCDYLGCCHLVPHLCLPPAVDKAFREAALAEIHPCCALEPIAEAAHWGMCCLRQRSTFPSDLLLPGTVFAQYFSWSKWLQCVKEFNKKDAVCTGAIYCVCIIWASKLSVQYFFWNINCLEDHFRSAHISLSSCQVWL